MLNSKSACHKNRKSTKDKYFLAGVFLSAFTIILHLIHYSLPLIMPLLILLNIPMPAFLHHVKIPFVFTLLSILWIIYYLLRKKTVIVWVNPLVSKYKMNR